MAVEWVALLAVLKAAYLDDEMAAPTAGASAALSAAVMVVLLSSRVIGLVEMWVALMVASRVVSSAAW